MLPLAHTYIATAITGKKSPLLILGCILPDISSTSLKLIDRNKIHNSPKELYEYVRNYNPKLLDLALGVRLHSNIDKGADYYSDDEQVGYAKIEGASISEDVAKLIGLPNGDISEVLAHNFIELAIDLLLYKDKPEIWNVYREGLLNVTSELPIVAECVGKYLTIDSQIVLQELNRIISFLHPNNFVNKEIAVEKLVLPLIRRSLNKDVSTQDTLKIVEKAIEVVKPTYMEFLEGTVIEVGLNIL